MLVGGLVLGVIESAVRADGDLDASTPASVTIATQCLVPVHVASGLLVPNVSNLVLRIGGGGTALVSAPAGQLLLHARNQVH